MSSQPELLKPKRGRPSLARAEALDRLIVDVARRMFLADGYDAVAMEQVAAEARVAKGTLYARHPSKEALFEAVVEASIAEWSAEASRLDHLLTDDIEQRLRHYARTISASLQRDDVLAFQRLTFSVGDRFPEVTRSFYLRGYCYIIGLIASDISAAAERDAIPVRDPRAVAQILVDAISGHRMQDVTADKDGLDSFAQRAVDLLMAARATW